MKKAQFVKVNIFQVRDETPMYEYMEEVNAILGVKTEQITGWVQLSIIVQCEGEEFMVSSIMGALATETMVFKMVNGKVDYADIGYSPEFLDFSGALESSGMELTNVNDVNTVIEGYLESSQDFVEFLTDNNISADFSSK